MNIFKNINGILKTEEGVKLMTLGNPNLNFDMLKSLTQDDYGVDMLRLKEVGGLYTLEISSNLGTITTLAYSPKTLIVISLIRLQKQKKIKIANELPRNN